MGTSGGVAAGGVAVEDWVGTGSAMAGVAVGKVVGEGSWGGCTPQPATAAKITAAGSNCKNLDITRYTTVLIYRFST